MTMVHATVEDGTVCGFVSVRNTEHWSAETDAYIGELVVASGADGQGIGSALLQSAETWARHRGLRRLRLETGAANRRALTFHAARGFDTEDVRLSKRLEPEPPAS